MGSSQSSSRIIVLNDIQSHLSQCTQIDTKYCPVYGDLHRLSYQSMEFYLGKSNNSQPPSQLYLHYLIPPNLLIIPNLTLFQNTKPQNYDELIQLMSGTSKFLKDLKEVYIGHGRLGYANRWGLVGERQTNWPYNQIKKNRNNAKGIYLSPTLIQQLSQEKRHPVHDQTKSDIFALGIMLVEIIFSQNLSVLFDYVNYEIVLKPLLEKLSIIRREFGDKLYGVIIKMLELEQQDRIDFNQFYRLVSKLEENNNGIVQPSQKRMKIDDLSNIKARTPRHFNKSPDGIVTPKHSKSKSPFKKDLRINTVYAENKSPRLNYKSPASTKKASFIFPSRR